MLSVSESFSVFGVELRRGSPVPGVRCVSELVRPSEALRAALSAGSVPGVGGEAKSL